MDLRRQEFGAGWFVVCLLIMPVMACVPAAAIAQRDASDIEQYIGHTGELLLWARDLVMETESDPALRVLRRASDLNERSSRLLARGRLVEATNVARRARDGVWHAVRVAREAMGLAERIRIRIERFREQHGRLTERAREANNQPALDLLDRARQQAIRARDLYHQGDLKMAWRLFEQAADVMHRAARLVADGGGTDRLEHDYERVRQLLESTRERLEDRGGKRQLALLSRADDALQRALSAYQEGQPARAFELVDLAGSLVHRVAREMGGEPDGDAVQRQRDRFDVRASRVSARVAEAGSDPARQMLARALKQRDRAVASAAKGELDTGLRQLRAAHDLLDQTEALLR